MERAGDARRSGLGIVPNAHRVASRASCSDGLRIGDSSSLRQALAGWKPVAPAFTPPLPHIPERVGGVRDKLLSFRGFLTPPIGGVKACWLSWMGRNRFTPPTQGAVGGLANWRRSAHTATPIARARRTLRLAV